MADIHIAFAATPNWLTYTQVSILSILEHANNNDNYHFYIMSSSFPRLSKGKFLVLNKIREAEYTFIKMDNSAYDGFSIQEHLSCATNYRLNLPSIIKADKVLYLDTDTLIMSDIAELYNIDISDYYVGAIIDKCSDMMKCRVSTDENFVFFNAGVVLMNLKAFRENNLEKLMMEYLVKHAKSDYIDQDALNHYCENKIKYLNLKFNLMVGGIYTPSYPKKDKEAAEKNPVVLHYIAKPWNSNRADKFYKEWMDKYITVSALNKGIK